MIALWKKEIIFFFSSISGYLIAGVFLLMTSLFLWVIPGNLNIPLGGYASLDSFFWLAPWLFMFLVPAVTMRLLAEERKSGTIELLFTKPISNWQIITGKYLAGLTLVVISILPTLIFFYSIHYMAQPFGNIDHGGIWGSYIGLVLLASVYTSIGLFTSSVTDNQVVAFVLAVISCFFFFYGLQTMASIPYLRTFSAWLVYLSIDEHYRSMSRGVIDSRDIVYFAGLILFFLLLARTVLNSRKW